MGGFRKPPVVQTLSIGAPLGHGHMLFSLACFAVAFACCEAAARSHPPPSKRMPTPDCLSCRKSFPRRGWRRCRSVADCRPTFSRSCPSRPVQSRTRSRETVIPLVGARIPWKTYASQFALRFSQDTGQLVQNHPPSFQTLKTRQETRMDDHNEPSDSRIDFCPHCGNKAPHKLESTHSHAAQ